MKHEPKDRSPGVLLAVDVTSDPLTIQDKNLCANGYHPRTHLQLLETNYCLEIQFYSWISLPSYQSPQSVLLILS